MVPIIRNQSLVGYPTVLPSGHLASPFFTKLPAQLRLAIYKYVFDDSTVLARIERPGDYRVTELRPNRQSILLTCHAIYSEVLHVYWSHTGTLHAVQYSSQQCYCHRPPKRCLNKSFPLPQNVREHIKHVVLDSPPFGRRRSIEAQESLCEFLSKFRSLRTCDLGLETILVPHKVSPRSFDWASVATRGQTPQERLARHVGLRLACTTEIQFTQEFKYMRRARAVKSLKVLKRCLVNYTTGKLFLGDGAGTDADLNLSRTAAAFEDVAGNGGPTMEIPSKMLGADHDISCAKAYEKVASNGEPRRENPFRMFGWTIVRD